jgi:peptidoglycan hydrolase CwlO-like protein
MQQALLAKDEQLDAHRVQLDTQRRQLVHKQATIDKLTHEMAVLKRLKFAARSERYGEAFNAEQKSRERPASPP